MSKNRSTERARARHQRIDGRGAVEQRAAYVRDRAGQSQGDKYKACAFCWPRSCYCGRKAP